MNYFIKQLSVYIICMLMANAFAMFFQEAFEEQQRRIFKLGSIESRINFAIKKNENILMRSTIDSQRNHYYLKPDKSGKLGNGGCAILWKCKIIDEAAANSSAKGKLNIASLLRTSLKLTRDGPANQTETAAAAGATSGEPSTSATTITSNTNNFKLHEKEVAVKFSMRESFADYDESDILREIKAVVSDTNTNAVNIIINNKTEIIPIEEFGIPAIYFIGLAFYEYQIPVIGMTLCGKTIAEALFKKTDSQSELNFLCAMYQALFSIKFLHGYGVIHQDVKPGNLLINGQRLVLIDFSASSKLDHPRRRRDGTRAFGSVHYNLGFQTYWMDDIKSLFYSIVAIAGAELKWINMQDKDLLPLKIDFDANRKLCTEITAAFKVLQGVLLEIYDLIMMKIDPVKPINIGEDRRIPPYNQIGEIILKGIEKLTNNKSRDVLFKWKKGEKSTDATVAKSKWIITIFNSLPGGDISQIP